LHNAVVTECGAVYTWGCSDDGSLGRTGDESIPLKVEGLPADDPVIGTVMDEL
jgi:alpha-tubulin suppressor-like RCC1 family protein